MGHLDDVKSGYKLAYSPCLESTSFDAINQVLMGLTHAMSNILMPLREYPRLIQNRLPEGSSALGLLSNMEIAADRLCEVNNNLIQLCHGNEGTPSSVNLVALTQQVLAEVADQYPADGQIHVEIKADPAPPVLDGPQDAIFIAIRNMCVNAYEAMKGGGRLRVDIGPVEVRDGDVLSGFCVPSRSYFFIRFSDTGPGVDPAVRDSMFDPFVTTVRGEGRGLGLSQVYRTMRHMNGAILYNPDTLPGASFILLFPA